MTDRNGSLRGEKISPKPILLHRMLFFLSRLLLIMAALSGAAMAVPVVYSVFMRYVVGMPVRWTEELGGLITISLIFMSLPYLAMTKRHITVTLVVSWLPLPLQIVTSRVAAALVLLFSIVFGYLAFDFMLVSYHYGSRSSLSGLLLFPWMALIPLSCFLWGCISTMQLVTGVDRSELEESFRA